MDRITVLALRAKAGDRRSLDEFVRTTARDVHSVCRYLGYPSDPDDLTQETFERALKSLHRYRADASAKGWLLSIARRVCADSTRRAVRGRRLVERIGVGRFGTVHVDDSWYEIEELLSGLDPERREAFVLTQLAGLSYAEAADAVGCPVGTIRSRVARARAQLIADGGVDAALIA